MYRKIYLQGIKFKKKINTEAKAFNLFEKSIIIVFKTKYVGYQNPFNIPTNLNLKQEQPTPQGAGMSAPDRWRQPSESWLCDSGGVQLEQTVWKDSRAQGERDHRGGGQK